MNYSCHGRRHRSRLRAVTACCVGVRPFCRIGVPVKRAIWAAFVIALGSVVGFGGGCSSDDPAPASSGTGGVGGAGNDASVQWSQNACHGCFASRCGAELSACGSDPTCAVFAECVDGCPAQPNGAPSPSCVQGCPGASGASAIAACLSSAQAECTACGGSAPDAAVEDSGACAPELFCQECAPSVETNPCWKCQDERCCDSDQACKGDPGCLGYFLCYQACEGSNHAACIAECDSSVGAEHFVKFNTKITCLFGDPCATECGGPDDECYRCINAKCALRRNPGGVIAPG